MTPRAPAGTPPESRIAATDLEILPPRETHRTRIAATCLLTRPDRPGLPAPRLRGPRIRVRQRSRPLSCHRLDQSWRVRLLALFAIPCRRRLTNYRTGVYLRYDQDF